MSSSTDAISIGSVHEYSDDGSQKTCRTPSRHRSSPSRSQKVSDEVKQEIEDLLVDVPQLDQIFSISNKIGSGTFSSVYVANLKGYKIIRQQFALKHIIPTSHPTRIENELRCLQEIGGEDHVMGVKACIREKDHVVIVMPYFPHERFQDYVLMLTVPEVREYMRSLLLALRRVHCTNIIHRDVKPSNFLYDRQKKLYALVDFGLAQKAPSSTSAESKLPAKRPQHKASMPKSGPVSSQNTPTQKSSKSSLEVKKTQSPKKRKPDIEDIENQESPRKRQRQLVVGLAEIDTNIPVKDGDIQNEGKLDPQKVALKGNSLTPDFQHAALMGKKSPRRLVLTKRAIDMQKKAEEATVKSAPVQPPQTKRPVIVERNGKAMFKSVGSAACQCFGKPMVCSVCMSRSTQHAPRAGTPGFRSPEVLMKCPDQTTAVDVWAAGVIFLSLLSGRYPFFKSADDMTALAQIISVFGSEEVKAAAKTYGKCLLCNPTVPALNLRIMCQKLRGMPKSPKGKSRSSSVTIPMFSDHAYDLLQRLMDLNPKTRISAEDALRHPFFAENDNVN